MEYMKKRLALLVSALFFAVLSPAQTTPLYQELYRPQFHFSSQLNWLNDPNGLVYQNGIYHLFYQYNPYGTVWGNMTWGHAISTNLVQWQELAPAIYPDGNGTIFSGSAVIDTNNTAGFGANALVCMFTYNGNTSSQGLAYSTDNGQTVTKYPTPVINEIVSGNRDPRVFWYGPASQWRMALYLSGNNFGIFGSSNLKNWTQLSTLTFPGGAECPDIYPITLDGNSSTNLWIFTCANCTYMVGSFNGTTFTPQTGVLQYEYGSASYAGQTWNSEPNGRRVNITWMNNGGNWCYPGMPFNQQMSIPKEIKLKSTAGGPRLYALPVSEVANLRRNTNHWSSQVLYPGTNLLAGLGGRLFDIQMQFAPSNATAINLTVGGNTIQYNTAAQQLSALGQTATVIPVNGQITLRVLVDVSSLEVFANNGAVVMTSCYLTSPGSQPLSLTVQGGAAALTSLDVYGLSSAWFPSGGTVYWDLNGASAGSGGPAPSGNWGGNAAWNTAADGTAATVPWIPNSVASFAAGSDATGSYSISLTGTQQVAGLEFRSGSATLSGGALDFISDNATINATNGTQVIQSPIFGLGNLVKNGGGLLVLSNVSSYYGATAIQGGTVKLAGPGTTGQGILASAQAYYTFNNATNLGLDSSGNGNTLVTATGTPIYANNGQFGGALYLDGNSTLTTAGFPAGVPTNNSPFTIAAWIKPDTGCSLKGGWIGWGNPANNQANNLRLNGSTNGVWAYWWNNDFGGTMASGSLFDGNFHSVVATWDGTTEILYIDGANVGQRTPTPPNVGAANFVVGKTIGDANFKGWIDDLLIANRALSAAEVANLMAENFFVTNGNALPTATTLQIAAGATLDLNGLSQQAAAISDSGNAGGGNIVNSNSTPVVLAVNPGSGTSTFSGQIQGGGTFGAIGLVMNGAGTQALAGTNSYTGPTTISAGTLLINGSGQLGGGNYAGNIAINGTAFSYNSSAAQTLSGVISGSGALTDGGSGTLMLAGTNSFTGNTTLSAGVLQIGPTGMLYGPDTGASTVTIGSGATLQINAWTYGAVGDLGYLDFGASRLVINGGSLEYLGGAATNGNGCGRIFTIGTGGATLKASGAGSEWDFWTSGYGYITNNTGLTLTGIGNGQILNNIVGAGALTKSGTGTWKLSGTNSFAGLIVNGGTNTVTGNTTISGTGASYFYLGNANTAYNGTLDIENGATLTVNGNFADNFVIGRDGGSGTVIQNGGTFNYHPGNQSYLFVGASSNPSTQAIYDMNGGLLNLNGDFLSVGFGNGGVVITGVVNQVGGVITNVNTLQLPGLGWSGCGIYTLKGGSIYIGSGGITTSSGTYGINLGGGTVGASASWASSLNVNLTGSNGPVTFDTAANTVTLSGTLSGNGGLTKNGAGTLILGGYNSYAGDTTVNNGTLQLNTASLNANAAVRLASPGGLNLNFAGTNRVGALYLNGVLQLDGIYNASRNPGLITGAGALQVGNGGSTVSLVGLGVSGGTLSFSITNGGGSFVVQVSTNLANGGGWVPVFTDTGPFIYTDSNAVILYQQRFYRVLLQ